MSATSDRPLSEINKALRQKALADKRMKAIKAAGTPAGQEGAVFNGSDKADMNAAIAEGNNYADQNQSDSSIKADMETAMDKLLKKKQGK